MERHLIAFEGPIGVSKTDVVRRVAEQLDATTVLDEAAQNPFLQSFYEGRPGAALQTELFLLLSRYRQQQELLQRRLFSGPTLVDYVFERSKLFAYLNLDDNELLIFDKLFSLLAESVPRPDLVVYLQSPLDSLTRRVRERGREEETHLSEEYVAEVNQAYNYYFFHYTQTPLLVVNIADVDLVGRSDDLEDLVKQIRQMGKGTRYYVPLGSKR